MIGIINAMDMETDGIKQAMEHTQVERISGVDYHKGSLYGVPCVVARCGVGKVNAAICAQTMCLYYQPDLVLNTGVAGGLRKGVQLYDIAIASELIQHDVDTTALGDPIGLISGLDRVTLPCDKEAVEALQGHASALGLRTHVGTILTGDQFVSTEEKRSWLLRTFGGIACDMEGGAIAHVCLVNAVAFAAMRVISDSGDSVEYSRFAAQAAEESVRLALSFVQNMGHM